MNEDLLCDRAPIGTDCWPTVELVLILLTTVELVPILLTMIDLVQGVTLVGGVADASPLIAPPVFRFGPCTSTPLHQLITFMEITAFGYIHLHMIMSSLNVHRLFLHPTFLWHMTRTCVLGSQLTLGP